MMTIGQVREYRQSEADMQWWPIFSNARRLRSRRDPWAGRYMTRSLCVAVLLIALCAGMIPRAYAASFHFTPIRLPADAAMHADWPNEWWYVTGHLRDAAGTHYGFELVTFKFGNAHQIDPLLRVNTLYRIDLALTDETHKRFFSHIEYIVPSPGKPVLSTSRLKLRMVGSNASLSVDTVGVKDLAYHLVDRMPAGAIDLTVRTARPPLLEGGKGLEQISDGYSYYYSLTNLVTTGSITLHGKKLAATGLSWMDHQWGKWNWLGQPGWDWMAIQLADGTSLSLVNFTSGPRRSTKSATIGFSTGSQVFTRNATMTALAQTWTSPRTHIKYPLAWKVKVPTIGLDAVVTTSVPNQEMVDPLEPFSTYWEGSGRIVGALRGKPISGLTYTELAGYFGHGLTKK
jgi:predicted secreted hydrolase